MRLSVSTGILVLLFAAVERPAFSQSLEAEIAADAATDPSENPDALPGTLRVTSAAPLAMGLALSVSAGYGYTEDVFKDDDTHHRMRGAAAATYRPVPWLAAGLRMDGRYDYHNAAMDGSDDGYVADARLNLLASRPLSSVFSLGGQLTAWIPGSISGLSVDAKAIATVIAGPVSISINGGFRLDRSAESIDNADALSRPDRLALGVSDSNAILMGVGANYPLGSVELIAEGTLDLLVGADAPPAIESPLRAAVGVRFRMARNHHVSALLEGSFGRVPLVDSMQPLVPVEPLIALTIAFNRSPKGLRRSLRTEKLIDPTVNATPRTPTKELEPTTPRTVKAGLSGTVRDDAGEPISGAVVRIAGREVLTGDGGTFVAEQLAPGSIQLVVSASGYGEATETVVISKDEVREINVILKRLELGTIRGVVQTFDGSPVVTEVTISPGDYRTTSKADGSFEVKLPAGTYTAKAVKAGFITGESQATIKIPGPTVIINLELRKAK